MRPTWANATPRLALAFDRYVLASLAWATQQMTSMLLGGSWSTVETETRHVEMLCAQAVLEWELANTPTVVDAHYDDETIAELLGHAQI